jgi:hypothetical protein
MRRKGRSPGGVGWGVPVAEDNSLRLGGVERDLGKSTEALSGDGHFNSLSWRCGGWCGWMWLWRREELLLGGGADLCLVLDSPFPTFTSAWRHLPSDPLPAAAEALKPERVRGGHTTHLSRCRAEPKSVLLRNSPLDA